MSRATYKSTCVSEELIDNDIVGDDPADPVKVREGLENVVREPIPARRADEYVEEEAFTANTPALPDTGVLLMVQCVEKGAGNQIDRPDCDRD